MALYPPALPSPNVEPADQGYLAWVAPLYACAASTIPGSGTMIVMRMFLRKPTTLSRLDLGVVTAGSTLANVGAAMYNAAGNLLTSSVNTNGATATAFQSTGLKSITFTAQSLPAGPVDFGFWWTGTTGPTLARPGSIGNTSVLAGNLSGSALLYATSATGLTTTAPSTVGTKSAALPYWMAAA